MPSPKINLYEKRNIAFCSILHFSINYEEVLWIIQLELLQSVHTK